MPDPPVPQGSTSWWGLTEAQKRFVEEYLVKPNATQAALKAGLAETVTQARDRGRAMLLNPDVAAVLELARREREKRFRIDGDRVLEELQTLALSDLRDVLTWQEDGTVTIRPSSELDPMAARTIKTIQQDEEEHVDKEGGRTVRRRLKVQLHDKRGSLEALLKHLGPIDPAPEGDKRKGLNLGNLSVEQLRALREILDLAKNGPVVDITPEEETKTAEQMPTDPELTGGEA